MRRLFLTNLRSEGGNRDGGAEVRCWRCANRRPPLASGRFRCEGARIEPELTHGPSGQKRLPTPGPERRIGPDCCALPSPRLRGRSRSRRPSELADRFDAAKARPSPAGRGRNVRRAAKNPARLMVHNGFDCCSLSHRERVRVRGKAGDFSGTFGIPRRSPSRAHLGTAPAGP